MKSWYKKFTLCTKLYFYLKCLENTLLQITSDFVLHYVKIHKLYFAYHHLYTNIQSVNIIAIIASDFTSNFGFCGLDAYYSFCTKIHKLYFPYQHLYTNIQISKWLLFAHCKCPFLSMQLGTQLGLTNCCSCAVDHGTHNFSACLFQI